jgi:hypothetical protein
VKVVSREERKVKGEENREKEVENEKEKEWDKRTWRKQLIF